ncbi:MAG: AIR synthase-related protein [Caldilineaceae bacterium]
MTGSISQATGHGRHHRGQVDRAGRESRKLAPRPWASRIWRRPCLDAAVMSMLKLNRAAAAARITGVRGATDITGFGLLGHGSEMAVASPAAITAGLRIHADQVPALPGVMTYIAAGFLYAAAPRNPETFGEHVRFAPNVTAAQRTLLWEVETSGGLLLAVPADGVKAQFEAACITRSRAYWPIGDVVAGSGIDVV